LRDCTLIAIATGRKAQNLKELLDVLKEIPQESIYYHFWGGLLRPRFDDPEFNNDFAAWVRDELHELRLAERLGIIDPTDYPDMEALRWELVEIIEDRLDENEPVTWTTAEDQYHFVRSKIVVFDTHHRIEKPEMLPRVIELMSPSSVFYHFIDARHRTPDRIDDFSTWLSGYGDDYEDLRKRLAAIDPYFSSLTELKERLQQLFFGYFGEESEELTT